MKKRLPELLVIYLIYYLTLLLYIYLNHGSILRSISSVVIWLIPFIVIVPVQFIAFLLDVVWPQNTDRIDKRIYRITHLIVYLLIFLLVMMPLLLAGDK
ncbi:hypothetical protein [Chitinophaga solisilvae]|uniref:Uncharacterized protein n=1 Tax=Chitinophaga solisilvae TaxID=1233460 RepID=A0A3S1B517_9BACT|nr:hypothetical protein [Chitinophaga solisilvae]NSL88309.1 hypothetical protein [Chitinophaga solisilvae]